jgi:uncharacterized membrane protein YkoI
MKPAIGRRGMALALAICLAGAGAALADNGGDSDHDEALRAVEEGHTRPLSAILDELQGKLGGKVVGVEFEAEGGRYIYEFKVITPAGDLREVYVDAATAEILDHGE